MKSKFLTAAAASLLLAVSSFAADVSGKWAAEMQGPRGSMTTTFTFKAEGDKLTGTVSGRGGDTPITLQLTLFGGEWQAAMDVQVDGATVATVLLDGSGVDDFIERQVALPPALAEAAREDGIEVRFAARDGRRTPRLIDLRLLNADAAP